MFWIIKDWRRSRTSPFSEIHKLPFIFVLSIICNIPYIKYASVSWDKLSLPSILDLPESIYIINSDQISPKQLDSEPSYSRRQLLIIEIGVPAHHWSKLSQWLCLLPTKHHLQPAALQNAYEFWETSWKAVVLCLSFYKVNIKKTLPPQKKTQKNKNKWNKQTNKNKHQKIKNNKNNNPLQKTKKTNKKQTRNTTPPPTNHTTKTTIHIPNAPEQTHKRNIGQVLVSSFKYLNKPSKLAKRIHQDTLKMVCTNFMQHSQVI